MTAPEELEAEEWRPVPGFNGYTVSSLGRITGPKGQVLRLRPNRHGRIVLATRKFGKKTVHALVCAAFIGPRPEGLEIDHLDGNPANNRAINLEYVTHSENMLRRFRTGISPVGEKHNQAKLTNEQVTLIRASTDSHAALAREHGVSEGLVRLIRNGKVRRHG